MKNNLEIIKVLGVFSLCMLLGVVLALVLPYLRYNINLPPPKIYSEEPSIVYEYILKNPGNFQFLDVRSKGEYDTLHATSSVSFPIADMYEPKKFSQLDPNKRTFLICTSGRLAGVAYRYLEHFGHRNIVHIDGGVQGWIDAGLPAEASSIFR